MLGKWECEIQAEDVFKPVIVYSLKYDGYSLNFLPPLFLNPFIQENTFICLEDKSLGIDAYGLTREDLLNDLREEVKVLWEEYAEAEDEILTDKAKVLKYNLLNRIQKEEERIV